MSWRVRKDLRNLSTESAFALMLITFPFLILYSTGWPLGKVVPIQLGLLAIATSWLGSGVIGKDISLGFLSFSLAQVESRQQLWREKMRLSILMIGTLFLLSMGALTLLAYSTSAPPTSLLLSLERPVIFVLVGAIISITGLGGGAFFSLILRSYQGAFWLTLLTPFALAVIVLFPFVFSSLVNITNIYWGATYLVTCIYGFSLYLLARKQFFTWQDLGPWGGEIWFPTRSSEKIETTLRDRCYRPMKALARKELSLQHLNLLITSALLLLYIAGACTYDAATQGPKEAAGLVFFARTLLLFFLPLAIGATSIAEERRLKINQWQNVLPLPPRNQWLIKLGTVYLITVLSTILMPLVIDSWFEGFWIRVPIGISVQITLAILIPLLAVTIGLYASSLSHSFLIALGSSGLVILGIAAIWFTGLPSILARQDAESAAIPHLLFAIVLVIVMAPGFWALCYANYQSQRSLRLIILSNGAAWFTFGILAVSGTHLAYSRSWERISYRPPSPGPPIQTTDVKAIIVPNTWLTVLAPNGTLWTTEQPAASTMVQIGQDSDWIRAFATFQNIYFIKRDGRMFQAKKSGPEISNLHLIANPNSPNAWKEILATPGAHTMMALQSDGSLWTWKEAKDGRVGTPVRYLPDYKWKSAARDQYKSIGIKEDGTLWAWGSGWNDHEFLQNPISAKIQKETQFFFYPARVVGPPVPEMLQLYEQQHDLLQSLRFTPSDGTDPYIGMQKPSMYRRARNKALNTYHTPYRIGTRNDWESVSLSGRLPGHSHRAKTWLERVIILTRTDGSVWVPTSCASRHWQIDTNGSTDPFHELPIDLIPRTIHSYQTEAEIGMAVLARDGTLNKANLFKDGQALTVNLSKHSTRLSQRNNWLSFARSFYTTVALSNDGLLWHAGPYPLRDQPGKVLPLIIPASRNLRPVFDFNTGTPY